MYISFQTATYYANMFVRNQPAAGFDRHITPAILEQKVFQIGISKNAFHISNIIQGPHELNINRRA